MSTLYIVATPIGNLEDITLRALEILKRVSVVYCEDTRVTRKLMNHYKIETPLKSYHQHSDSHKIREVIESLRSGDVALVTDAGTPGIADPGNELIHEVTRYKVQGTSLKIVPIPGPSAVTAAASICGFDMSRFIFLGYVPKKKGRTKFFERVAESDIPVILYEAPYRIVKTLEDLTDALSSSQVERSGIEGSLHSSSARSTRSESVGMTDERERRVVVCRELTKQFESVYRGGIEEVITQVQQSPIKGEYVIVIEGIK